MQSHLNLVWICFQFSKSISSLVKWRCEHAFPTSPLDQSPGRAVSTPYRTLKECQGPDPAGSWLLLGRDQLYVHLFLTQVHQDLQDEQECQDQLVPLGRKETMALLGNLDQRETLDHLVSSWA